VKPFIGKAAAWLHRRAENVLAAMIGVVFVAFVAQIAFRYLLNFPIGWTSELSVIAWLWLVLWGAGFVVKEDEEIRFDLVSGSVRRRTARVMGIVAGVAILILYAASLPATIKYVTFMKVERSAYLHIRFDILYSIYVLFVIAVIVRYVRIVWQLLRHKEPEGHDPTGARSDR
jgi:TRAP-type C4-dicarboxylate transport system permease small subunit